MERYNTANLSQYAKLTQHNEAYQLPRPNSMANTQRQMKPPHGLSSAQPSKPAAFVPFSTPEPLPLPLQMIPAAESLHFMNQLASIPQDTWAQFATSGAVLPHPIAPQPQSQHSGLTSPNEGKSQSQSPWQPQSQSQSIPGLMSLMQGEGHSTTAAGSSTSHLPPGMYSP